MHTFTALSHVHHPNTSTNTLKQPPCQSTPSQVPMHIPIQGQHTLILHFSCPCETVGSRGARATPTVCAQSVSIQLYLKLSEYGKSKRGPHLLQSTGSSDMEPITLPSSTHSLAHICLPCSFSVGMVTTHNIISITNSLHQSKHTHTQPTHIHVQCPSMV